MKTSNLWNVTQQKITHQEEKANGYKLKLHNTELRKRQIKSLQKKENQKRYEIKLAVKKSKLTKTLSKSESLFFRGIPRKQKFKHGTT